MALLWLLSELTAAGDLGGGLAGIIHVNHGLRGDESARDQEFCRALADRIGLPCDTAEFDVAASARAARRSVEATARDVRYQFFADAAARLGATVVATGHTLDDQAETVLLRLLRGAGGRGAGGIRVRRGPFIRPLLTCRRDELRAWLAARGEPFCEDSSNDSLDVARNRIRHQLVPVLEQIAPGGVRALARFAALSAADESFLEAAAIKAAETVVLIRESGVQLHVGALAGLPAALGRRVVRQAIEHVAPRAGFRAAHLDAVLDLATAEQSSGHLDLPGLTVERAGATLSVRRRGPSAFAEASADRRSLGGGWLGPRGSGGPEGPPLRTDLTVPGSVDLADVGLTISATIVDAVSPEDLTEDSACLQASAVTLPLTVRTRRPGDRLRPLGAPGRRKVQDLMVDRKVPRAERDRVPIVVDAAGQIVWVVGLTIAEECRVTVPTTGVVVLKVRSSLNK